MHANRESRHHEDDMDHVECLIVFYAYERRVCDETIVLFIREGITMKGFMIYRSVISNCGDGN